MRRLEKMRTNYYTKDKLDELIPLAGIYRLFESISGVLNLVYIGKSRNVRWRLKEHSRSSLLSFDLFNYEFYPERMLSRIEKEMLSDYLQRFGHLPKFNKQLG